MTWRACRLRQRLGVVIVVGSFGYKDLGTLRAFDLLAKLAAVRQIQFRETTRTLDGDFGHERLSRNDSRSRLRSGRPAAQDRAVT